MPSFMDPPICDTRQVMLRWNFSELARQGGKKWQGILQTVILYLDLYKPPENWQQFIGCQLQMRYPVYPYFFLANYNFLGLQYDCWPSLRANNPCPSSGRKAETEYSHWIQAKLLGKKMRQIGHGGYLLEGKDLWQEHTNQESQFPKNWFLQVFFLLMWILERKEKKRILCHFPPIFSK